MKKIYLFFTLFLFMGLGLWAQSNGDDKIYTIVEENASFPGGEDALIEFLRDNIVYPELAKKKKISGRVYVSFVVEKDGSLSNIKILKDLGDGCGEEVIRVVRKMPRWKPGRQKGEIVRQIINLPVSFAME